MQKNLDYCKKCDQCNVMWSIGWQPLKFTIFAYVTDSKMLKNKPDKPSLGDHSAFSISVDYYANERHITGLIRYFEVH